MTAATAASLGWLSPCWLQAAQAAPPDAAAAQALLAAAAFAASAQADSAQQTMASQALATAGGSANAVAAALARCVASCCPGADAASLQASAQALLSHGRTMLPPAHGVSDSTGQLLLLMGSTLPESKQELARALLQVLQVPPSGSAADVQSAIGTALSQLGASSGCGLALGIAAQPALQHGFSGAALSWGSLARVLERVPDYGSPLHAALQPLVAVLQAADSLSGPGGGTAATLSRTQLAELLSVATPRTMASTAASPPDEAAASYTTQLLQSLTSAAQPEGAMEGSASSHTSPMIGPLTLPLLELVLPAKQYGDLHALLQPGSCHPFTTMAAALAAAAPMQHDPIRLKCSAVADALMGLQDLQGSKAAPLAARHAASLLCRLSPGRAAASLQRLLLASTATERLLAAAAVVAEVSRVAWPSAADAEALARSKMGQLQLDNLAKRLRLAVEDGSLRVDDAVWAQASNQAACSATVSKALQLKAVPEQLVAALKHAIVASRREDASEVRWLALLCFSGIQ